MEFWFTLGEEEWGGMACDVERIKAVWIREKECGHYLSNWGEWGKRRCSLFIYLLFNYYFLFFSWIGFLDQSTTQIFIYYYILYFLIGG